MSGPQTIGASDSFAGHYTLAGFVYSSRPLPMHPIGFTGTGQTASFGSSFFANNGVIAYYISKEPSAVTERTGETPAETDSADVVKPAGNNTSAVPQWPPSAEPYTEAAKTATTSSPAAAAATSATSAKMSSTSGVTKSTNTPPKRLSVMHQKFWAKKLEQDAKDPKAAAQARAARIERRQRRAEEDARIKAEEDKHNAAAAAAARTDTADAGADRSNTAKDAALPAFFYSEREWEKKWWSCHADRCT